MSLFEEDGIKVVTPAVRIAVRLSIIADIVNGSAPINRVRKHTRKIIFYCWEMSQKHVKSAPRTFFGQFRPSLFFLPSLCVKKLKTPCRICLTCRFFEVHLQFKKGILNIVSIPSNKYYANTKNKVTILYSPLLLDPP